MTEFKAFQSKSVEEATSSRDAAESSSAQIQALSEEIAVLSKKCKDSEASLERSSEDQRLNTEKLNGKVANQRQVRSDSFAEAGSLCHLEESVKILFLSKIAPMGTCMTLNYAHTWAQTCT